MYKHKRNVPQGYIRAFAYLVDYFRRFAPVLLQSDHSKTVLELWRRVSLTSGATTTSRAAKSTACSCGARYWNRNWS